MAQSKKFYKSSTSQRKIQSNRKNKLNKQFSGIVDTRFSIRNLILVMIVFAGLGTYLLAHSWAITKTFNSSNCIPPPPVHATMTPCGYGLYNMMNKAAPGDIIKIAAGTYNVGHISPTGVDHLTVTAADSNNRPTLIGWVNLWHSQYVTISNLRFQAANQSSSDTNAALTFLCGKGITIKGNDIYGADQTKSFSNMTISGNQQSMTGKSSDCPADEPNFVVSGNAFYRPGLATDPSKVTYYHHIYTTFSGTGSNGGVIEHNLFYGCINGPDIKLGYEPLVNNRHVGPQNVTIRDNTFVNGQGGIVAHWDSVKNNKIYRNLFVHARDHNGLPGHVIDFNTTGESNNTNEVSYNYAYDIGQFYYQTYPTASFSGINWGPDNVIHSVSPNFNSTTVDRTMLDGGNGFKAFIPQDPVARNYGITAPDGYSTGLNTLNTFLGPTYGATVKGTNSAVTTRVTSATPVNRVEYWYKGQKVATATTDSYYGWVATWDTTKFATGTVREMRAIAYDTAGNKIEAKPIKLTISN